MIKVNLDKAKDVAHAKRRADRDEAMKPLDLHASIPMYAAQAEADRQKVRDQNAILQSQIDKAKTVDELKSIM